MLTNTAILDVSGAGNEIDNETAFTNSGTLEVLAGGVLALNSDQITNAGGTIQADATAQLTLNGSTVSNGTVTNHGTLDLTGNDKIQTGVLTNTAILDVSGAGNEIDNETAFTNSGTLEVLAGGVLALNSDQITNAGGTIQADATAQLTLNGTTVSNGTVTNYGTLDLTGNDKIQTGVLTNTAILDVSGAGNEIDSETAFTNSGTLEVLAGGVLALNSDQITNAGGTIQADATAQLTLNGSTVSNGTVTNHGTLDLTGNDKIQTGALTNTAILDVSGAGNEIDSETAFTNSGTLEVLAGGVLALNSDQIANAGGTIQADATAQLTLNGTTVSNGTVTNHGTLDLTGNDKIQTGVLTNTAILDVSGAGNEIDNETAFTNSGTLEVLAGGVLALNSDQIANAGGTIQADATAQLTLNGTTVSNGTVTNHGTLDLTGNDKIQTGVLTNAAILDVSGAGNEIDNETAFTNSGTLEVLAGGVLALNSDQIANAGGTIQADATAQLTLNGSTINGGTINDGTVESGATITISGSSEIENAVLNNGGVTVDSGQTLTLDNDVVTGTTFTDTASGAIISVDAGHTLTLSGVLIDGGAVDLGSGAAITISGSSEIENASLNNGGVTVDSGQTLTLDNDVVTGTTFTDTASGATISVDAGHTLTLSGVLIDGGAVDLGSGATITISGSSEIENASLNNGGVTVDSGQTLTLDNDVVTGTVFTDGGSIVIDPTVKLEGGADITGGGIGTLKIDAGSTLDVEQGTGSSHGATLDGLNVADNGALDVGDVSSGANLTLDDGTSITGSGTLTIHAGSTLDVDGGTTTINVGGTITNAGVLEASNGGTLTIESNVNNSGGTLLAASGGTLEVKSEISGGSGTIQGGTLQFDEHSNVNVTFDNSHGYGKLVIGDADGDVDSFGGQISGFSGSAPDAAHSDVVELNGFTETCYSVQCINGNEILTMRDAHGDVISLTFDNFDGKLVVNSSGGDTYIYDPPAGGSKDAPPTPPTSAGHDHIATPADTNGSGNDHAMTSATGTPPTGSFGAGNDSFTFHPNLGSETQNTGAQTTELARGIIQGAEQALASIAPQFHQEFAFDAIHQDAATTVDQFHHMVANSTLLH